MLTKQKHDERKENMGQRHDGATATETPISALLLYGRDKAEATCVSPQRTSECNGALPPARGRRRTHYSENYNKKKEKERSTTYGRGAEGKGKGKKQMITRKKKTKRTGAKGSLRMARRKGGAIASVRCSILESGTSELSQRAFFMPGDTQRQRHLRGFR